MLDVDVLPSQSEDLSSPKLAPGSELHHDLKMFRHRFCDRFDLDNGSRGPFGGMLYAGAFHLARRGQDNAIDDGSPHD
jgi:hypothetical protein